MRSPSDILRRLDQAALPAGVIVILVVLLRIHAKIYPNFAGWFGGFDQRKYLLAAQAWGHWQLDPSLHFYPPGYSLLAAPFIWLMPSQPFAIPDAACLVAALALFLLLSKRLVPASPGWRAGASAAFLLACLGTATLRQIWTIPWNSTAAAPFTMAALLATLRLCEAPSWQRAAIAGLCIGGLAAMRPTDAILIALCCAPYAAYEIAVVQRRAPKALLILAAAATGGLLAGVAPFAAAHVAINGFSPGLYLSKSAGLGFEWRLLPLRWVTLVLDARPLLPEGVGLAEGLPWIAPGFAGLIFLAMMSLREKEHAWRLVAAAIAACWIAYLCYRDLQPYGLWRFYNLHYFKWTFPFLTLAGMRLIAALGAPRDRRLALVAVCAAVPVMVWQPVGRPAAPSPVQAGTDAGGVEITQDLSNVLDAVFLPVQGSWRNVYFNAATLSGSGQAFRNTRDFKLLPVQGGALLQPVRLLPNPPLVFRPGPDTTIESGKAVIGVSEGFRLGIPCGIFPHRAGCRSLVY